MSFDISRAHDRTGKFDMGYEKMREEISFYRGVDKTIGRAILPSSDSGQG
jgi:hypothetical protein